MSTAADPRVHVPISGRLFGFALASLLAVVVGIFAIIYFAMDSARSNDPTAQGLMDDVPPQAAPVLTTPAR